ncbi:Melanoma inhibitory activity protein 3 [Sciurus carolinensis]|uniref:Melanoma inhibitory activity protein 3 n=1 Tax=Sciurus carolinensis TaxID=30640 RepID=A0AA41MCP3_SCICA|nr:Melanoma inhibitory activity protein 3 [Sciurus carolinensis]
MAGVGREAPATGEGEGHSRYPSPVLGPLEVGNGGRGLSPVPFSRKASSPLSCPYTMDSVPATVPSVAASRGDPELLGPRSVLYAALIGRDSRCGSEAGERVLEAFLIALFNGILRVTEQQISEKLKNIKKENDELVQILSSYEQKIRESKKHVQETKKQNMVLSDEAIKYKDKIKLLEETNEILDDRAKSLHVMLESEREQNVKNEDLILENKKSIEKLKDVISMNASEFSEVQIALNEAKLSEGKVKSKCHRVQEEIARLKKKEEQLQQEIEDGNKSHADLSEQIKSFEKSQKDLEIALPHKDDNINALTNFITLLNRIESESESEGQNKGGDESEELASGEVGDQIKKLEDDCNSLQSAKAGLEDECKTLKQKVEILNELYQHKKMDLQKKLSQEEYERQEREQRLSAADEKAILVAEEVKTYKLLEMTQKMAMRQDEPLIVKPMLGRPNTQNPPQRGSMDGPLPRPRWSSEASGKHFASGPGVHPPLGLREYAPGVPPGKWDLPLDQWEFLPGPTPFRPLGSFGPREYFFPGTRLSPPTHGPQDYSPSPPARDLTPSGSRDEPSSSSQSSGQDCSQALKQSL